MRIRAVLSWNVGPGRAFSELQRDLRHLIAPEDDVVSLCEMSERNAALLRVAFPRWRVYHPKLHAKGKRRTDVVVMVRRRLPLHIVGSLSHNVRWIGPKEGLVHVGRGFIELRFGADNLLLVHRVPGGPKGGVNERTSGRNLDAWEADLWLIGEAIKDPGPIAVIGDHNATARELRPEYKAIGLRVHASDTKVDHAAERGYPRMHSDRLAHLGSDHPAVRWFLR